MKAHLRFALWTTASLAAASCGGEIDSPVVGGQVDISELPPGVETAFDFEGVTNPETGTITLRFGTSARGLDPARIVQDGVTGSGPPNSVELATLNTGTDGACGFASSFCANVQVSQFYSGPLRDVFAQITQISPAANHGPLNSDPSSFGLSNQFGLWGYGNLAPNGAGVRQWVFGDDDTAWQFSGRVMANLCFDRIQDGAETGVDCGGGSCVPCVDHLTINEIDYDMVGAPDNAEFVEIYNGTGAAVSLTNMAVILMNGNTGNQYRRMNLSGTLANDSFLVLCVGTGGTCSGLVGVAPGAMIINMPLANDNIQNGNPDAVGLFNYNNNTLVDALSYGGSITNGLVTGVGRFNFVEGSPATVVDTPPVGQNSLQRSPNNNDTNNAATDWVRALKTPGAANL